jgi:uncharacterized delta-60 repeat protein
MIGRLPRPVALAPLTGAATVVATFAAVFVSPAAIARPSAVGSHPRSVDLGKALAISRDGKLVVAGVSAGGGRFAGALARYTGSGRLDTGFGVGGRVLTDIGPLTASGMDAVAIQADGKIVVAGGSYDSRTGVSRFVLARYTVRGHLDPTFGRGGRLLTRFGTGRNSASVSELEIQPDGKLVAAGFWRGTFIDGPDRFALARYTVRGRLDPSFGQGGKVVTSFGAHSDASAAALAIQPDGKLVVAGTDLTDTRGERGYLAVALARYKTGGTLDPSFGAGGRVVSKLDNYGGGASAAVIEADGRIVLAGSAGSAGPVLLRYTADGKLDPSFGARGIAAVSQFVQGLALQQDGKFVVVGSVDGSNGRRDSRDFAVSRYTPNGVLDPSFGRGGKAVTDLGAGASANAIAVQTNGKIMAAGTRGSNDFALVRYLTSGKLDGGFGRRGRVLTDFGPVWARR